MFKIAICDDEDTLIQELRGLLERYAAECGMEFCFFSYHDGSELLEQYNLEYDLIFLDIFAHYTGKDEPFLHFSNQTGRHKVPYRDLCYGETSKRNVMLHFDGQEQVIYKTIKELAALLCSQPQFAQCHQSFVVNLSYVKAVEGLELILSTGERIPVSHPKRKAFMQKLTDYWGDML